MFEEACMPIEEVIEKYRTGIEEKLEKRNKNSPNEGSTSSMSSCLSLLADVAAASCSGSSRSTSSDQEPSNSDADNEKKGNLKSTIVKFCGQMMRVISISNFNRRFKSKNNNYKIFN